MGLIKISGDIHVLMANRNLNRIGPIPSDKDLTGARPKEET